VALNRGKVATRRLSLSHYKFHNPHTLVKEITENYFEWPFMHNRIFRRKFNRVLDPMKLTFWVLDALLFGELATEMKTDFRKIIFLSPDIAGWSYAVSREQTSALQGNSFYTPGPWYRGSAPFGHDPDRPRWFPCHRHVLALSQGRSLRLTWLCFIERNTHTLIWTQTQAKLPGFAHDIPSPSLAGARKIQNGCMRHTHRLRNME